MAKAKGIRVNQLAKELGISNKDILEVCRIWHEAGELNEPPHNHQSLVSIGLAETLRQRFAGAGGVATAVEPAPETPEEEAPPAPAAESDEVHKAKARARKKKAAEEEAAGTEAAPAEPAAPSEPQPTVEAPAVIVPAPEPVIAPVIAESAAPEAPVAPVVAPPQHPAPAPIAAEAPSAPVAELAVPAPAVVAPVLPVAAAAAAHAPVAEAPAAKGHGKHPHHAHAPASTAARPTVNLATLAEQKRKAAPGPALPPPKFVNPTPATIQGPRIVRVEEPEHLPAPRGPRRPAGDSAQPGIAQARSRVGGGVKSTGTDEETEETEAAKKKPSAKGKTLSARRRGLDGRRGEADAVAKIREFTEADLEERRKRLGHATQYATGVANTMRKESMRGQHGVAKSILQRGEPVEIEEPITVRTLSSALGIKINDIISRLMKQGKMATINQGLDHDVAEAIALEYGVELQIRQQASPEELLEREFTERAPVAENLVTRPPVVTILGHVDHGKTSLLDKIRNANVAAGEAGGITQHTAAWTVVLGEGETKKRVTFIDTPGHQAFTAMRARGANMTDVVVLVVSAAEGVQPQTIESINHARAAGVPIVVAMNKIDRPDANPDMVLGQLAKEGLNPVEWGGETEVIRTSATTGVGIPELIEILDYQSQLLELKTDPSAPARGMVIESRMDEGLGPIATVLVQDGTLRAGDVVVAGSAFGRVRSLYNDRREPIAEAGAATPVIVAGLNQPPGAGDKVYTLEDLERARSITEERAGRERETHLAQQNRVTSANLLATITSAESQTINLIVKADVQGSIETLVNSLAGVGTEEVKVRVIHSGVGPISESDVQLAMATRINPENQQEPRRVAIIGFHVVPEDAARALAEHNNIDVKLYKVIYEIFDDLKKALSGMLTPEIREKYHGRAEIRQVYKFSKVGNIAGCMVVDGHIQRGSRIRLIRNGSPVTEDMTMESLRRVKDDVREVKQGFECGIKLAGYDDIKIGDVLEAYIRETIQRTL